MMANVETLPRRAPERDSFSPEAIRDDILNNVRRFGGWQEIAKAPADKIDEATRHYLANVEEARQSMLEAAKWQDRSEEDRLFIDTMYQTEMVRVWHLRRPADRQEDFAGLKRAIDWQNRTTHYEAV